MNFDISCKRLSLFLEECLLCLQKICNWDLCWKQKTILVASLLKKYFFSFIQVNYFFLPSINLPKFKEEG